MTLTMEAEATGSGRDAFLLAINEALVGFCGRTLDAEKSKDGLVLLNIMLLRSGVVTQLAAD